MAYKICGLVCAPGGFGTLDELFEILTLKQTGRIKRPIPIILFGKSYWESIINFQAMCDHGMISQDDVNSLFLTDDADEALKFLCQSLEEVEQEHNEMGSPFLAPMRDSSGAYAHDAMGRLRLKYAFSVPLSRVRKVSNGEVADFKLVQQPMQARSPETSPIHSEKDSKGAAATAPNFQPGGRPGGGAGGKKPTESVI
eukprot:g11368.t1